MKPETEIRNLKRDVKSLRYELKLADENTRAYRARATKAEQEVAEWKARFDALLMRTPKLEGGEGT